MSEKTAVVICGATASGKTGFSVDIAKAIGGEVVSADCMLVYKRLNIGTAKPTVEERKGIPHYMIDIAEPEQSYSVSDYENAALPLVYDIVQREKVPVICGGTGFYIQSLLFERQNGNVPADARIREKYENLALEKGKGYVHSMLAEVDPESAEKLHPNDLKRVIRALEIFECTGRKKSEQRDGFEPRIRYAAFAFDYPRNILYERIDRRVDQMLSAGLVDEVESLYRDGIDEHCQCMQGIGYKEVLEFLKNRISYSTMSDMIKQNTRNYAKRQITFFKKFPNLIWLDPEAKENVERVSEYVVGRKTDF